MIEGLPHDYEADEASAQLRPLLLVAPNPALVTRCLQTIQGRGILCEVAFTSEQALMWQGIWVPSVAILDLSTYCASELLDRFIMGGTRVVAVSESSTDRDLSLQRGCSYAIPLDCTGDEIATVVKLLIAQVHRSTPPRGPICVGPLEIDFDERLVWWHGSEVHLPRRQFDFLGLLARNPGQLVDNDTLMARVWADPWGSRNCIYPIVKKLRENLPDDGHILNRRGEGYVFIPDEPKVARMAEKRRPAAGGRESSPA